MKDPDKLWKDIAYRFAEQSKCLSRKVGCVIVSPNQRLIGQGYNGAPPGSECSSCPRCHPGIRSGQNLEKALCTHSEANAISYAAKAGIQIEGSTLYCTTRPCLECSKLILGSGIKRVVYYEDYPQDTLTLIKEMFKKAKVEFIHEENS